MDEKGLEEVLWYSVYGTDYIYIYSPYGETKISHEQLEELKRLHGVKEDE